MIAEPTFTVEASRVEGEKEVFKAMKKFLKQQELLSREMDPQKKIACVSEDILANLNLVVEAMQKDTKEYMEQIAQRKTVPSGASGNEETTTEKKKSKKRNRGEQEESNEGKEENLSAEDQIAGKKQKKKKKEKDAAWITFAVLTAVNFLIQYRDINVFFIKSLAFQLIYCIQEHIDVNAYVLIISLTYLKKSKICQIFYGIRYLVAQLT